MGDALDRELIALRRALAEGLGLHGVPERLLEGDPADAYHELGRAVRRRRVRRRLASRDSASGVRPAGVIAASAAAGHVDGRSPAVIGRAGADRTSPGIVYAGVKRRSFRRRRLMFIGAIVVLAVIVVAWLLSAGVPA